MLCYLPWDVKVVVNDINGNLTNLYMVIRDRLSDFVSEVMINDGITRTGFFHEEILKFK